MGKEQINTTDRHPMYIQLREILRSRIEDGEFIPGSAIPSESELVQTYGLHRLTVRSAINTLVNEGLLKPVQGKGVFVVGKKLGRDLEKLTGFRQTIRERNVKPETRVMVKTRRPTGLKYGQIFKIPQDDELYYIRRLCLAENEPVSIEDIYVPTVLLSDLEVVDLNVFSLFDIYKFNGIQLSKAWQTLSVTNLDAKDARILQIKPETKVLMFECVSHDETGRVIEFSRSFSRSDKASFTVHYSRDSQKSPD
jgi:GntR family transcriptional regulator